MKYSKGSAYRRITAARAIREHPEILEKLEAGLLSLCAVAEIYKVPEEEVRQDLFVKAEGKSRDDVAKLVAHCLPAIPAKSEAIVIRRIEVPPPAAMPLFSSTVEPTPLRQEVRYSVTLEVDPECMELLLKAQALTGAPSKAATLKKVLKLYVTRRSPEERMRRRAERRADWAVRQKTRTTRHIPVATRDEVTIRDGGCCTFVGLNGHPCSERIHLEVDHIQPFGMGGNHDEVNLRLLCRNHNQLVARHVFGGGERS